MYLVAFLFTFERGFSFVIFFFPFPSMSDLEKNSLSWNEEESKTHLVKLFRTLEEKETLGRDMENCLIIIVKRAVSVEE